MFIVKIYAASVEQVLSRGFNVSEGKEDYYLAQKKKSLVLVFLLIFFYYLFVWLEQCSVSLLTFSVIHNFLHHVNCMYANMRSHTLVKQQRGVSSKLCISDRIEESSSLRVQRVILPSKA